MTGVQTCALPISWLERMDARPAVKRALDIAKEEQGKVDLSQDDEARKVLFGQRAK